MAAHHDKTKKNFPYHEEIYNIQQLKVTKDDPDHASKQHKVDTIRNTTPAGTGEHNTRTVMQAAAAPRIKVIQPREHLPGEVNRPKVTRGTSMRQARRRPPAEVDDAPKARLPPKKNINNCKQASQRVPARK